MITETKKPLVTNAANSEQVKQAAAVEKRGRELELEDVKKVLSTEHGRRFYWNLMCFCGIFKSSFNGQFQTFYNEGQRNVGLKLLAYVDEAYPEAYALMSKEAKELNK